MKLDQISFYCKDEYWEGYLKQRLGLEGKEWIVDTVKTQSLIRAPSGSLLENENTAILQFNYDLGIEVELLRYTAGPHWHLQNPIFYALSLFPSHHGFHLEDGEAFPDYAELLVQESWTFSHTNKYLTDPSSPGYRRRYHYKVYQVAPGTYLKYIQRIHPEVKADE